MSNQKIKLPMLDRFIKKSIGIVGIAVLAGVNTLISLPMLAQLSSPYALFQPPAHPNYRHERGNIVDILNEESNFVNLVAELEEAGLAETLKEEKFTILAPTDAAFEALPDNVFAKFSKPENRIKVLQYHLISGEVTPEEVDRGEIKTVAGNSIAIANKDSVVILNDANAKHPSTLASNGVIIEIDKVLLPPDF